MIPSDDVGLETWRDPYFWFAMVKVSPEGGIAIGRNAMGFEDGRRRD